MKKWAPERKREDTNKKRKAEAVDPIDIFQAYRLKASRAHCTSGQIIIGTRHLDLQHWLTLAWGLLGLRQGRPAGVSLWFQFREELCTLTA